jgi:hypothetical protein
MKALGRFLVKVLVLSALTLCMGAASAQPLTGNEHEAHMTLNRCAYRQILLLDDSVSDARSIAKAAMRGCVPELRLVAQATCRARNHAETSIPRCTERTLAFSLENGSEMEAVWIEKVLAARVLQRRYDQGPSSPKQQVKPEDKRL